MNFYAALIKAVNHHSAAQSDKRRKFRDLAVPRGAHAAGKLFPDFPGKRHLLTLFSS